MSTLRLQFPAHHPGQTRILSERKRFNVAACGRRFGKSLLAIELVSEPALKGLPTQWFAPSYKILEDAWRQTKTVLEPVIREKNESSKRIELVTGGTIEFWTLDGEDPARSRKAARAIIDEAGLVAGLADKWNMAIRPVLADYRGDAFFFGTPKGRNFFWEAYTFGQDPLNTDWASWQMPTSTNPYIHPDEIKAAQIGMPDRAFRQEFLAEFIEDAGGVFRGVSDVVAIGVKSRTATGPVTMGVDIARVNDFTVITIVDSLGNQCYFERFNQISWERQIERICSVSSQFGNPKIYLDSTGVGDPIFEQLRKKGLRVEGYKFSNKSKEDLIDNLAILIEKKSVSLLDIPEQTNELQAYAYEMTAARNVRMNAPEGMHDDTVISLALAAFDLRARNKPVLQFF